MPMKAVSKGRPKKNVSQNVSHETSSETNSSSQPELPENPPNPGEDDGVVMVLFPVQTWQKVQEMAREKKVEPAAILSVALEVLEEKMKESEDGS